MSVAATATLKQPRALYYLFFTEMWERFSFYGMKALLLAYMVTQLRFDEPKAYAILGSYAALVYAMPMFGGLLADRILGFRKAVYWGGLLMCTGHLVLAIPLAWSFYPGMAFIICGNGFFKPNISSLVGTLYERNDTRKDSAFSLFYMGINIGAALGGLLCGYVGQEVNWHLGFGLAGLFMFAGLIIFRMGQRSLGHHGLPPVSAGDQPHRAHADKMVYLFTLLSIPVILLLFNFYSWMNGIMLMLGAGALLYLLYSAFQMEKAGRNQLLAATVMIVSSVVFWSFYSQNTGSLNLYATRNIDMHFGGVELAPLAVNNFLPPFWVITLSPVFAWIWLWLGRRRREPSTPLKFALSFFFLAASFALLYAAGRLSTNGMVSVWALIGGYALLICGELCLSPIGLSMVTKLSPGKMVGMVMGIWFLATALGEFLASKIGALMAVPALVQNPVDSLPYYQHILSKIAMGSLLFGALLLISVPLVKRWMRVAGKHNRPGKETEGC